jgi:hypothetical protein
MALATAEATEVDLDLDDLAVRGRQIASQISRLDAQLIEIVGQIGAQTSQLWGKTSRQYVS